MGDESFDEPINIFAHRADDIIKSKLEAYERLQAQTVEDEEETKNEDTEYIDLMGKIKEKMKRKPAKGKKGKGRAKKAKADTIELSDEEEEACVPPPVTRRNTRRNKRTQIQDLTEDTPKKSNSPVKLPVTAKRRLNELKLKTAREAAQLEEEIRRTISSCDNDLLELSETMSPLELDLVLKINYLGTVSKVQVKENEKFASIFNKVAELYQLKANEILLCLEDRNINVDDTPQSLNLKFYDVIDCIPFKDSQAVVKDDDPNMLLIKVQSSDSRKKIEMHIHKLEKFQDMFEKYSKLRDIPTKDLRFEFDGETIEGSETPEELEMESGSCIDVKVTKPDEKKTEFVSSSQSIPPIPRSEMLDICVLD